MPVKRTGSRRTRANSRQGVGKGSVEKTRQRSNGERGDDSSELFGVCKFPGCATPNYEGGGTHRVCTGLGIAPGCIRREPKSSFSLRIGFCETPTCHAWQPKSAETDAGYAASLGDRSESALIALTAALDESIDPIRKRPYLLRALATLRKAYRTVKGEAVRLSDEVSKRRQHIAALEELAAEGKDILTGKAPEFWLVWRSGGRTPVFRHHTKGSAEREAERLAQANPGVSFYVLPATRFAICPVGRLEWRDGDFAGNRRVDMKESEVPF